MFALALGQPWRSHAPAVQAPTARLHGEDQSSGQPDDMQPCVLARNLSVKRRFSASLLSYLFLSVCAVETLAIVEFMLSHLLLLW